MGFHFDQYIPLVGAIFKITQQGDIDVYKRQDVDGVTYYFRDNEYYFKRRGLYGFYDDGERFAVFSRAVLETLFYIDFTPDIINCNDWQTRCV